MTHRVIIQPRALRDLDETFQYFNARYTRESATKWYTGFLKALNSLERNPCRFGVAREKSRFKSEIRQLIYRRHESVHRELYTIEGQTVRILCVRHAAQAVVEPDNIAEGDIGER